MQGQPENGSEKRLAPLWGLLGLFLALLPALLRGGLALDDQELLFANPATGGALPIWEVFTRDYFHHLGDSGQWRPMATLSLRLDRWLFGGWIPGYHLSNGLLQVAVVGCAYGLGRGAGLGRRALCLGLVIFALHPALADSVVWIAGRTSMLSALFPLAGAWMSLHWLRAKAPTGWLPNWRHLPAALGLLLGLLAKEDALIFCAMLPLIGGRLSRNAGWSLLGTALLTLGVYLIGRHLALGCALPQAISPALGNRTLLERLPVGGAIWLESLRLAVLPTDFPPQYREWFLFERVSWWRSPLMGWLLFFAPLAVVLAKRRLSVASSAVLLAVFALLPVTQLVPLGEIFAPRFLYLPLLFLSVPVGLGLASWLPSGQTNKALLGLALVLSCALHWRAEVYSGKQAWLDAMLQQQPADVPALNSLGLHLEEQGQAQDAIQLWLQATRLDPKYSRPWSNLGRVQMAQGDLDGAEESLRMALRAGPKNPVPRVNLATLLTRQGEHAQAVELYREATRLSPGLGAAWRGLGLALVKLGQLDAARSSLEKALQLDPGDALAKEQWRRISPPQQTHD